MRWVLAAVLGSAALASAVPKSASQLERDAVYQKAREDIERKKVLERENREAEERQRREEAAERALYSDPAAHYRERIQNRYRVVGGQPEPLRLLRGRVLQVADGTTVLLNFGGDQTVAVRMGSTAGIVDEQQLSLYAVEAGTLSYANVLGARRTVAAFEAHPGMTFEEYQALRAAGMSLSRLGAGK
jgi:hypothetical protein